MNWNSKKEKKDRMQKKNILEKMTPKFTNLIKKANLQIQEAQQFQSRKI